MALTATARGRVRDEIRDSLGIRKPHVRVNSFYRTNLTYSVRRSRCRQGSWEEDLGPLFLRRGGAGEEPGTIVYTPSRKEAERIAAWLAERGVSAAPYHAKLPQAHLETV